MRPKMSLRSLINGLFVGFQIAALLCFHEVGAAAAEVGIGVLATGDLLGLPVPVKDYDEVLEKGYRQAVKAAVEAGVPLFLSVSGHTADMINIGFPRVRDMIAGSMSDKWITILVAPYSPVPLTLIDDLEADYAVRRGRASCAAVWPIEAKVLGGLPSGLYDLSVPRKLRTAGIELLLGGISLDDLPPDARNNAPAVLMGPGDHTVSMLPSLFVPERAMISSDPGAVTAEIESRLIAASQSGGSPQALLEISLDTPFKRKGEKGDPEKGLRELFAALKQGAGAGYRLLSELPAGEPTGDTRAVWVAPKADYSRLTSGDDNYRLLAGIQRLLPRLSDLNGNRRLVELSGGQDISMQILLVDEARRQLALAADCGLFDPDAPKDTREISNASLASAERLIGLAEALYAGGLTFEAVEITEWRYASGESIGGANPLFGSPRSEFWSAAALPHVAACADSADVPGWIKRHGIENWPGGLETFAEKEQWGWYRTDKLLLPTQWSDRPMLILFDGLVGDAYLVANGDWLRVASRPENWQPVESEWGKKLFGRMLLDATDLLRPGRENRILLKIKSNSGLRGVYGKAVVISPIE